MTTHACRDVAAALERWEATGVEPAAEELAWIFSHVEGCPRCGDTAPDVAAALDALRAAIPPLPGEEFFAANARAIEQAIRAASLEPAGDVGAADAGARGRSARRERTPRGVRRDRLVRGPRVGVGWGLALAAGVVLAVSLWLAAPRRPTPGPGARPIGGTPFEVASVDGDDLTEIVGSDDAWLVARYDFFAMVIADGDAALRFDDLSDDELDDLEGVLGVAPGYG